MAITAEKLLPITKPSSSSKAKLRVKTISIKVNKINEILKGTLAAEKKQRDDERKSEEKKSSTKAEDALEKEQKKVSGGLKLPAPLKNLSPIDRIKNFLFNVLGGFLAVKLLNNLPMLKKLIPIIGEAMKFIENWGGKILDGLVTLIGKGYEMYDGLRKKVGEYFGEDGLKKFDEISSVLNKVLNGVLIAGAIGLAAARFNPMKGKKGAGVGPKRGFDITGRRVSKSAQKRYFQRFGRDKFIQRFGSANLQNLPGPMRRSAATRLARGATSRVLGRGGSRVALRFLKNFISPIVKRIPIIGGLIDFALNFFVFKEPIGRAAFAAIGATIFGALGAMAGSVIPVAGNLVGGILGGLAGDIAGKWLYDTFFSGKRAVQVSGDDLDTADELVEASEIADAEIASASELDLFKRLVAAEAETEGILGMALVARSVLNRTGLIQSGKASTGTFLAKNDTITGVIMGRNQYQPISDGRINNNFGPVTLENAERAIKLAQSINELKAALRAEGYDQGDIAKLISSTGFRTGAAFSDPSQNVNVVRFKNHYFNTAGNKELRVSKANINTASTPPSISPPGSIPGQISAGTGGPMVRSAKGTKLAGDLGRFIYKELTPQSRASDGVGDFSYASEHPDFGGSFKRSYASWHNVDRAIDIGGFWPQDQKKILGKVLEFNRIRGVQPVELLYGKPGTPRSGTHGDHVHVAYEKGGVTLDEPHLALVGEKGAEIVIDADSMGPAKDMLLAINQASTYDGVMEAIREYAPYDAMAPQTILVPPPPTPEEQYGGGQSKNMMPILLGGRNRINDSFDALYQGA